MMGGMGTSAGAGDPPAGQRPAPYLPEPTGPSPVGSTSLHLTDTSRPDPWAAGVAARELMVSLWYPATPLDGRRAPYMTPAESELLLANAGITAVPPDTLSTVRTNAASDAPPAGRSRSLPFVVLSPGFIHPRSVLTALAEDLASHGYVVAGVDHTYESVATAFPDGRVTTCLAREGLLRPAPAQQPANPAGPAVATLPRGHVLRSGRPITGHAGGKTEGRGR
jgi:predicted dienelactone hydrolase